MKPALRLGIALAFAVALLGQAPPKDVDGWDKFKWGMTVSDVSRVYDVQKREENEFWDHLLITPVKVGDMSLTVAFMAKHGAQSISAVQLIRLQSDPGFSGSHDFDTLKTLLTQKYGPPASEQRKQQATWIFPSTSIVLELGPVSITVQYKGTDKKALDAL